MEMTHHVKTHTASAGGSQAHCGGCGEEKTGVGLCMQNGLVHSSHTRVQLTYSSSSFSAGAVAWAIHMAIVCVLQNKHSGRLSLGIRAQGGFQQWHGNLREKTRSEWFGAFAIAWTPNSDNNHVDLLQCKPKKRYERGLKWILHSNGNKCVLCG